MPLPTFATCRCGFEVDLTNGPPPIVAQLEATGMLCGRCGRPMGLLRLFPALFNLSVLDVERRLALAPTVRGCA